MNGFKNTLDSKEGELILGLSRFFIFAL